jgi:ribose-phosphate pyrophosphokinase
MELVTKKKLHLVSGRANLPLAQAIATCLGVELGEANLDSFANGELHCRFGESVRGMDVSSPAPSGGGVGAKYRLTQ